MGRAMVSVADQIAELRREVAMRRNVYPKRVVAGAMTQGDADRKMAVLEAAIATLRFIEQHRDALRALIMELRDTATSPDDVAARRHALMADPAVAAVVAAFPGARILGEDAT